MTPKRMRPKGSTGSRKVYLYLADIAREIDEVAEKLGISRSKLLVRAWRIARAEIASDSDLPPELRRKRG